MAIELQFCKHPSNIKQQNKIYEKNFNSLNSLNSKKNNKMLYAIICAPTTAITTAVTTTAEKYFQVNIIIIA